MLKKRDVYFDFGLPVSVNIFELTQLPILTYQSSMLAAMPLSGNVTLTLLGTNEIYKEGDVFLINADTIYKVSSENKALLLILDIDISHYKKRLPELEYAIFSRPAKEDINKLQALLLDTSLTLTEQNKHTYTSIDNNIKSLIDIAVNCCQFFSSKIKNSYLNPRTQQEYTTLMQKILKYIAESQTDKITLKNFAKQEYMNENYLSHIIKKISGSSFKELIAFTQNISAEFLLLDSSIRINEISYLSGFSTPSSFKKSFYKIHSITPDEYRKSHLSTASSKDFYSPCQRMARKALIINFAKAHGINLTLAFDHLFTLDNVDINAFVEKMPKVMSNKGDIRNIDAEMDERSHQAFMDMQQYFRINTITIDANVLMEESDTASFLTISRNLTHLINSKFDILIELRSFSSKMVTQITRFTAFYHRRFIDTIEEIRFSINIEASQQTLNQYKKLLSEKIYEAIGLRLKIDINNNHFPKEKYFASVYDSFILTPFAVDELLHPETWNVVIDFSMIDPVDKNGYILSGGNGLLSWNGIKKPWWYAYYLVSKLRGNIISKGKDHIITNNGGNISILTYNTCNIPHTYITSVKTDQALFHLINTKGHIREHSFRLTNLYGNYKKITYSINETTCLFSKWANLGFPDYLTSEEEAILSQNCHPEVSFGTFISNGKYEISTKERSFGVTCVLLEKIL